MSQLLIYGWIFAILHVVFTWFIAIRRGRNARNQMGQAHWRVQQLPTFRLENKFETGGSEQASYGIPQPPVSILVPAWNESGTIEKCICYLQALDYPTWEALILAGGSDGTYEVSVQATAGDPRFRVLNRGPEPKNAAINRGSLSAQYDILVLLDADSLVEPGWLAALVEPLMAGASASIGMHFPSKMSWISLGEHMEIIEAYHILGTSLGQGCSSLAIRREVMERIGPLPVNAYSWEDADIGVRLAKAGEKVVFVIAARLSNERPATLEAYWDTAIRVHRAHLVLLWNWRKVLIKRPKWMIFECYFHILSAVLLIGVVVGLVIAIAFPSFAGTISQIIALVGLWMFCRRAALAGEIAAYTQEIKWLFRVWIPPILLFIQLLAADIGLFMIWRAVPFDYKGHREFHSDGSSTKK